MLCQRCGKKEATTLIKQNINGNVKQFCLCVECAAEMGFSNPFESTNFNLDIGNFLGGILGSGFEKEAPFKLSHEKMEVCPLCGGTLHDFLSTGKAGCPDCYRQFEERLMPMFARIHGTLEHTGKLPVSANSGAKAKRELDKLKSKLVKAIEVQEFEEAAALRDRIKILESEALLETQDASDIAKG